MFSATTTKYLPTLENSAGNYGCALPGKPKIIEQRTEQTTKKLWIIEWQIQRNS